MIPYPGYCVCIEAGRRGHTGCRGLPEGRHFGCDVLQLAEEICGPDAIRNETIASARRREREVEADRSGPAARQGNAAGLAVKKSSEAYVDCLRFDCFRRWRAVLQAAVLAHPIVMLTLPAGDASYLLKAVEDLDVAVFPRAAGFDVEGENIQLAHTR